MSNPRAPARPLLACLLVALLAGLPLGQAAAPPALPQGDGLVAAIAPQGPGNAVLQGGADGLYHVAVRVFARDGAGAWHQVAADAALAVHAPYPPPGGSGVAFVGFHSSATDAVDVAFPAGGEPALLDLAVHLGSPDDDAGAASHWSPWTEALVGAGQYAAADLVDGQGTRVLALPAA